MLVFGTSRAIFFSSCYFRAPKRASLGDIEPCERLRRRSFAPRNRCASDLAYLRRTLFAMTLPPAKVLPRTGQQDAEFLEVEDLDELEAAAGTPSTETILSRAKAIAKPKHDHGSELLSMMNASLDRSSRVSQRLREPMPLNELKQMDVQERISQREPLHLSSQRTSQRAALIRSSSGPVANPKLPPGALKRSQTTVLKPGAQRAALAKPDSEPAESDWAGRLREGVGKRFGIGKAKGFGHAFKAAAIMKIFGARLRKRLLSRLKKSIALRRLADRLWRETVASDFMKEGGQWTLDQYMDYHLSLFCYLQVNHSQEDEDDPPTLDEVRFTMIDAAWESALEDWETDCRAARGRVAAMAAEASKGVSSTDNGSTADAPKMDFESFYDSVFELVSLYADSQTETAFVDFMNELIDGTTTTLQAAVSNSQLPSSTAAEAGGGSKWKALKAKMPGTAPKSFADVALAAARATKKGAGSRSWRNRYPRQAIRPADMDKMLQHLRLGLLGSTYTKEIATTADPVKRKKLQRDATARLAAWTAHHGSTSPGHHAARIGTPADLMLAIMNTCETVKEKACEAALEEALSWISSEADHEIGMEDEAARARLIGLFRALDAGTVKDGRISSSDLEAALLIDTSK